MDVVFLYDIWTWYSVMSLRIDFFWFYICVSNRTHTSSFRQSHICLMHMETKPWKTDIEDHDIAVVSWKFLDQALKKRAIFLRSCAGFCFLVLAWLPNGWDPRIPIDCAINMREEDLRSSKHAYDDNMMIYDDDDMMIWWWHDGDDDDDMMMTWWWWWW